MPQSNYMDRGRLSTEMAVGGLSTNDHYPDRCAHQWCACPGLRSFM